MPSIEKIVRSTITQLLFQILSIINFIIFLISFLFIWILFNFNYTNFLHLFYIYIYIYISLSLSSVIQFTHLQSSSSQISFNRQLIFTLQTCEEFNRTIQAASVLSVQSYQLMFVKSREIDL